MQLGDEEVNLATASLLTLGSDLDLTSRRFVMKKNNLRLKYQNRISIYPSWWCNFIQNARHIVLNQSFKIQS